MPSCFAMVFSKKNELSSDPNELSIQVSRDVAYEHTLAGEESHEKLSSGTSAGEETDEENLSSETAETESSRSLQTKVSSPSQVLYFEGCGFLYPYYVGVIEYLIDYYDLTGVVFRAASAASFPVACYAANDVRPYQWMTTDFPKVIEYFENRRLGLFWDSPTFFRELWRSFLNEDAYIKASRGNLCVELSRFHYSRPFVEQVLKTTFNSNDDLIDTLVATLHVPGIYGRTTTKVEGVACFDGVFHRYYSTPTDEEDVIKICARAIPDCDYDIVADAEYSMKELLSPFPMEDCIRMARAGYKDALANDHIFSSRGFLKKAHPETEPETHPLWHP